MFFLLLFDVKFHGENVGILWNTENTDDQPVAFETWICLEGPIFRPQMQRSAKLHWQIQSNERNCVVDTVAASKFTTKLLTSDSYFSLVPLNEGWSSMPHFLKGQTERGSASVLGDPMESSTSKKSRDSLRIKRWEELQRQINFWVCPQNMTNGSM